MDIDRLSSIYDRIAECYATSKTLILPVFIDMSLQFLALLPSKPEVLGIGCGHGRDMSLLEQQGARVKGVDLSAGMLAQARSRVSGDLIQMDMRFLSFEAETFDGVWSHASLLHLPKSHTPQALEEMHRVLRRRGLLFLAIQEGSGEGWEHGCYGPHDERHFARYSEQEALSLLEKSGFALAAFSSSSVPKRTWLRFHATKFTP